jgi:hypothetical protein
MAPNTKRMIICRTAAEFVRGKANDKCSRELESQSPWATHWIVVTDPSPMRHAPE